MAFDPDAYLAEKNKVAFNPDAYLAEKGIKPNKGMLDNLSIKNIPKNLGNLAAGAVRGAGSIGATILAPADILNDAIAGKGLSLESNRARRADMDAGLQAMGADPKSGLYEAGKIGSEIAGTVGVGNALAGAKVLSKTPELANSIRSGGFTLGTDATKGLATKEALIQALTRGGTRLAGGAANAGASTLLTTGSPQEALKGVAIGASIPAIAKVAGSVGSGAYNAGKNIIAPFTQNGRAQLLADNLIKMLGDKAPEVARNLSQAKGNVEGFIPTAGQSGNNADLAAFERMMKNRNSELFRKGTEAQSSALAREANNLGGNDLDRINLVNARNDAVQPLYDAGKSARIESTPEFESLINRPAVKDAMNAAELNSLNSGGNLSLGKSINMPNSAGESHTLLHPPTDAYFKEYPSELVSGGQENNLLQQIKKLGGINQSHLRDITGENVSSKARAQVGLFNHNGKGIDDLASQLHDMGYIPHEAMQESDGGVQWLKDEIRNSLGGEKSYALHDKPLYLPSSGEFINPTVGDIGSYFNAQEGNKIYSGDALQKIKFALDSAKKFNPNASTGERMTQGGVMSASTDFNKFLADNIPELRKADAIYSDMSKPINQMDLGNEIRDRFIPAKYRDEVAPRALNRDALAKILQDNGDTLAQKVTGMKNATLQGSLSPKQYSSLENIVKDNLQVDTGNTLGKEIGSPTYQHFAYNAKGEKNGMLASLLSSTRTGKVLGAVRDLAYTKPLQALDADMANMLQNPNTTGKQINDRLEKMSQSKRDSMIKLLMQSSVSKSLPIMATQ